MDFFSPALLNTRFRKTHWRDISKVRLDGTMLHMLTYIDEEKPVSQICDEAAINLLKFREVAHKLWRNGMIVPINGDFTCRCHQLIEQIVQHRSRGNPAIATSIKAKLHLKGIDPNRFYPGAYDDPVVLEKLETMARSLGISKKEEKPAGKSTSRGMTRLIIDTIITQRSQGNPDLARNLRAKLTLKGINPQEHSYDSEDDPVILEKAKTLAQKMGVTVALPSPSASVGKIHQLIEAVVEHRSKGNPAIAKTMRAKLILKGIEPDHFDADTIDDPSTLKKMITIAQNFGVPTDDILPPSTVMKKARDRAKYIIQTIIDQKSGNNPEIAKRIKEKFLQRGLDPDNISATVASPRLLKKLEALAESLNVTL